MRDDGSDDDEMMKIALPDDHPDDEIFAPTRADLTRA